MDERADPPPSADVLQYYESGAELDRLTTPDGQLELERTKELVARFLRSDASVLDVGGGGGIYASWLAGLGHRVLLVEPVSRHIQEARRRAGDPPAYEIAAGCAPARFPTRSSTFPTSCTARPSPRGSQRSASSASRVPAGS